jgi:hypothetical protein
MSIYLVVGCIAIGFAIGCPFGVGATIWGMMDWQNASRREIAAMAMQGMLADSSSNQSVEVIASTSIRAADALIERLNADPIAVGGDRE